MAVVADGVVEVHPARLFMEEQDLELGLAAAIEGLTAVVTRGVTSQHPRVEADVEFLRPSLPRLVERLERRCGHVLQDEVPLNELETPLDLALSLRPVAVDDPDPQAGHILLEVGQPPGSADFN